MRGAPQPVVDSLADPDFGHRRHRDPRHRIRIRRMQQIEQPRGRLRKIARRAERFVAPDRAEAVFAYLRTETSPSAVGGRIRLPGLDSQTGYRLTRRDEIGPATVSGRSLPDWWKAGTARARGGVLEQIGLPAPILNPGQAVILHLRAE